MRKKWAVMCLLLPAAALLAASFFVRPWTLRLVDQRRARTVLLVRAAPGDAFVLSYIHSVERSPVRDFFRIDGEGRLVLRGTEFQSSNAGLPSQLAPGETLARNTGKFRISGRRLTLDEISLWVGKDHRNTLVINDAAYDLPALGGDALLQIRAVRTTLGECLLHALRGAATGNRHRRTGKG
ncbi:MAG: DUF1850 domain-containing protein [Pseudomonadota bacterium]|nr:DUF1850 domain-containing protein [Pseudomonadota bacterium]